MTICHAACRSVAQDAKEQRQAVANDMASGKRKKTDVLDMEVYHHTVLGETLAEFAVVRAEAAAAWAALELQAVQAEAAWATGLGTSGDAAGMVTVKAGTAE